MPPSADCVCIRKESPSPLLTPHSGTTWSQGWRRRPDSFPESQLSGVPHTTSLCMTLHSIPTACSKTCSRDSSLDRCFLIHPPKRPVIKVLLSESWIHFFLIIIILFPSRWPFSKIISQAKILIMGKVILF